MRRKKPFALVLLALVSLMFALTGRIGPLQASEPPQARTLQGAPILARTDIYRDAFGIPTIVAQNDADLMFAMGYASAADRLFQMDLWRRNAIGRLAEIFGPDFLSRDSYVRTLGIEEHSRKVVNAADDATRSMLSKYADGVNFYIATHWDELPEPFAVVGYKPAAWRPHDSIACWLRLTLRIEGGAWAGEARPDLSPEELENSVSQSLGQDLTWNFLDDAPPIVSEEEMKRFPQAYEALKARPRVAPGAAPGDPPKMSNCWLVDGKHSASGRPLLGADPQLPVLSPPAWYEAHWITPHTNARGIGIPGCPGFLVGFNKSSAWACTALGPDNGDLFMEKINPENPLRYWHEGQWKEMEVVEELIPVKGADASPWRIRKTVHGPVISDFLQAGTGVYSLKWVPIVVESSPVATFFGIAAAGNYREFSSALQLHAYPAVHFIYAGRDGRTAYWCLGQFPIRKLGGSGPHRGWQVDDDWGDYVPFEQLPRLMNPLTGRISTANNRPVGPWYPYYLGRDRGDNARSAGLRRLLLQKESFSMQDFVNIHNDLKATWAPDLVPALLQMIGKSDEPELALIARLFQDWNYRFEPESKAPLFFATFHRNLASSYRRHELVRSFGPGEAGLTNLVARIGKDFLERGHVQHLDGLEELMLTAARTAAREVISDRGSDEENWRWGKSRTYNIRYQRQLDGFGPAMPEHDLGPFSVPGAEGIVVNPGTSNSYTQIVDLADLDRSLALLPPGISEDPESPHFRDQIGPWLKGELRPAPLSLPKTMETSALWCVLEPPGKP